MPDDSYLVRVSREMIEQLNQGPSGPVVFMSIEPCNDGTATYDLILKTPEWRDQIAGAAHVCAELATAAAAADCDGDSEVLAEAADILDRQWQPRETA